jgi:hypothetical protein
MKLIILVGLVLLPWPALAEKECRVVEFPDHVEAVCSGKPDSTPEHAEQSEQAISNTSVTKGAQVSRRRQQLQDIRSLNAHRFDPEESPLTPNASGKTK